MDQYPALIASSFQRVVDLVSALWLAGAVDAGQDVVPVGAADEVVAAFAVFVHLAARVAYGPEILFLVLAQIQEVPAVVEVGDLELNTISYDLDE